MANVIQAWDTESDLYNTVTKALEGSRVTVATSESAAKRIAAIAAAASDMPVAIAGHGTVEAGEFNPESLPEPGAGGFTLSTIGCRGIEGADGKKRNGITGVAIYPAHTVDSIMSHPSGADYLLKLAEKEMGLVAFRGLRLDPGEPLTDLNAAAQEMPCELDSFISRTRQGAGSPYAVFNDNWNDFRKALGQNPGTKAIVKHLPAKGEMLNCIRSKPYAESHYAVLEENDWFARLAAAMANLLEAMQAEAAEAGEESPVTGDPDVIRGWLDNRESYVIEGASAEAAKGMTLDLSAFGA